MWRHVENGNNDNDDFSSNDDYNNCSKYSDTN